MIRVGNVEITRIEELVLPTSVRWFLPDAPADALSRARPWLEPRLRPFTNI